MKRIRIFPFIGIALLLLATAPAGATAAAGTSQAPQELAGVLLNLARDATVPVTLHVDSYTTTDEVRSLYRAFQDKGQRAVIAALAEMKPRGWIRVGDTVGFLVPVIRTFESDKGTKIFAILDRPFPIFQQLQGTRSPDYPFGMVEFKLNADGDSKGELVAAGRVRFGDDGTILMEGYGTKPYSIIGVAQHPVGK